ncbi:unnamed protein product, partial [Tetraodon nigroviridis]
GSGTTLRRPTWWPSGCWWAGSANWVSPHRLAACLPVQDTDGSQQTVNAVLTGEQRW